VPLEVLAMVSPWLVFWAAWRFWCPAAMSARVAHLLILSAVWKQK